MWSGRLGLVAWRRRESASQVALTLRRQDVAQGRRRIGGLLASASPARSLPAKGQTNFGLSSGVGQFPRAQARAAGASRGAPGKLGRPRD